MHEPLHEPSDEILDEREIRQMRRGRPSRLFVYELRDDDDYSEPTRRMIVTARNFDEAEAMWDDPETADNVFARPVFLKGRHLRLPGTTPQVLHRQSLSPSRTQEAA